MPASTDVGTAPLAAKRPKTLSAHGDVRLDEWAWLADADDPRVLEHLAAENAHTRAVTAALAPLRAQIAAEVRDRVVQTDVSCPAPDGAWAYYSRMVAGQEHPVHCRRPVGAADPDPTAAPGTDPDEQVLLDVNALAAGGFCSLGVDEVSPDGRVLAYSVDTVGDERYRLRFRDLTTGADLDDAIDDVHEGGAWAHPSAAFVYLRVDDQQRPYQVWWHRLGTPDADDRLLLQEDDERFHLSVSITADQTRVVAVAESKTTTECFALQVPAPGTEPDPARLRPFASVGGRRDGVLYWVTHHAPTSSWFVLTNDDGAHATTPQLRVYRADDRTPAAGSSAGWVLYSEPPAGVHLDDVAVLVEHLVLCERVQATTRLRLVTLRDGHERLVEPADPAVSLSLEHLEFASPVLRLSTESLAQPPTVEELDLVTGTRRVRWVERVPGYHQADYVTERLWATSADGTAVPMTVVRRRDVALDGTAPALLYVYGAYQVCMDPWFSPMRVSLLDRGFVYALGHVRGGGELGRPWYDAGRLANKPNTFADTVACAQELIRTGHTSASRLVLRGGSAGGLTVGAVLNLRPDLFAGAVAEVPFVDAVTTMSDPSAPLTVTEYDEWGNPDDPQQYAWIRGYSPFDNVRHAPYPAVLATVGLHDQRVAFSEAAKWVQRLRERTTADRPVLLRADLGSGHSGPSGRYEVWDDEAEILAFVVAAAGGCADLRPATGRHAAA